MYNSVIFPAFVGLEGAPCPPIGMIRAGCRQVVELVLSLHSGYT